MSDKDKTLYINMAIFFSFQKSTKIRNNNTLIIVKEPLNKIFSKCHHINARIVQEHLPAELRVHNI